MSQNFKVLFFLKKGKRCNEKLLPVYVRITTNGQRVEWSIQRSCDPQKWNQHTSRATGNKEDIRTLNNYLDTVQLTIYDVQKEYALRKEPLTASQVKSVLMHQDKGDKHSLVDAYTCHNEQVEKLVGAEFSHGTFKKFRSALTSLKKFIAWKFNKEDVTVTEVNHKFITDYEFYLKSIQKMQHNSAMGNIKKLKKIIRQCVANEWLDRDPFKSYKITTRETHRNFLLKEELEKLAAKEIDIQRLSQVRDIFLFSCYTGLSYSDVMALNQNDIATGIDGEQWIFTTRMKTNTASRIPLLPIAKNVIEKYRQAGRATLLPNLSNQRLNSYLKEIGDICGFSKELTFHCARHTFATTVTLTNGVPIDTVGKMLGHKNLRTTQLYAKTLDRKVSEDMLALRTKLQTAS